MDVDLLRPGTVPISPDTVLWFEFLLDPKLLKNHLSKPAPDPSPMDLIIKFSSIKQPQQNEPGKPMDMENPDSPTLSIIESDKYTKKQLALKVLCLKVAAFMKWNLSILESKLPPQIQSQLTQDLVYMATDGVHSIPPNDVSDDFLERAGVKFAVVFYHRWLLRFLVNRALFTRNSKQGLINMDLMTIESGYMQMNPSYEKLIAQSEESRKRSLQFLSELADNKTKSLQKNPSDVFQSIKVPTIDTFHMLTEEASEMVHEWDTKNAIISENEFYMQINYDLCSNYFFYGQYDMAKTHILLSNNHKERLLREKHPPESVHHTGVDWSKMEYASVSEAEIFGYMKALNISQENNSLLHQLHDAVNNDYEGLIGVLQADNLKREIPLVHRLVAELDIQGVSSSGAATVSRDLLNKVAALNVVRSLLDGNLPSTHVDFNKRMKNMGSKFVDILFWAFAPVLSSNTLTDTDRTLVKQFFLHLATSEHNIPIHDINKYLLSLNCDEGVKKLFKDSEIAAISKDTDFEGMQDSSRLPIELLMTGWDTPDFNTKNIPDLELGCLQQRLIDATTAVSIRNCLIDLAATNPPEPMWKINPQWRLPTPLQNVLSSLQRGFLQDFSYIILGKAKQLAEMGDHSAALELILILETEIRSQLNQLTGSAANNNSVMYKLWKLVGWEALLTQINQMLAEWPNHKESMPALISKCTMCILKLQANDTVKPRMEIIELCYICLLNAGEWKQLAELAAGSRGTGQAEAAVATALAAHHLRIKPSKKLPDDLWDMISPIFVNMQSSSSTKRNSSGNPINALSLQANNKMKDGMTSFFSKLRDPIVLSVVISLLAKLFNIQKDDSNMDLNMDYINLWPSKVNSTISLSMVSNSLHQLVAQALKYYPNNISWIKLLGDMSLVGGHYSTAMKQYLTALTILSDNFVQPLSKQLIEDQTIFRRMIKCCMQLNCPTQAAILCQFLEDIDYVLAFKCLSEMSHLCSDAMDSYYGCIWDTAILEYLINLHHKRGETHRKQLAVTVMGMLELNSNNNEEIQREAANKRKAKFMRALVKQYVC